MGTSRRLLLGLVVLLGLGLLALLPVLRTREPAPTGPTGPTGPDSALSPPGTAISGPAEEPLAAPALPGGPSQDPRAEAEASALRLLALRRADRTPIPGVAVLAGGVRLGEPSDDSGVIEFEREKSQPLVVWGEGWFPVFVKAYEDTPGSVLMDEATARLEVQIAGLGPEDKVVRSLLQPHAFPVVADSPWSPVLERTAPDRLAGHRLPAGDYDVYVWVARGWDAPRCLESLAVHVESAELALLELDARAPPAQEPDS